MRWKLTFGDWKQGKFGFVAGGEVNKFTHPLWRLFGTVTLLTALTGAARIFIGG